MTRIKIREKVVVKVDFLFIVDDRGLALRVFSYSIFTELYSMCAVKIVSCDDENAYF